MALTFDQITAITNKYYMPKFPQLVFDQNIVWMRLQKKGTKPSSGETIKQPVMYQSSKGGSYRPYDVFDISAQDQVTAADFEWKYYEVPITLSRDEILKNDGPEGVKKLLDAKMKLASMQMGEHIADDFFAYGTGHGDSDAGVNSLDNLLNDAADTLTAGTVAGGIEKASYSWWATPYAEPVDFGETSGTTGPIYNVVNGAFFEAVDGNITPTLGVCHNYTLRSYMASQQGQQRYMRQDLLDAGFMNAECNGKPIVADLHVNLGTSGNSYSESRFYWLNEDFLDFTTHSKENMRMEPFAKPIDQAVQVAHIMFAGNATVSDPTRHVVLSEFDHTATS